jgi:hypothetical protein
MICGTDFAKRVSLVTTMWDQISASAQAEMEIREERLISECWSSLTKNGSQIHRFDASTSRGQPWAIVNRVLEASNVFPPAFSTMVRAGNPAVAINADSLTENDAIIACVIFNMRGSTNADQCDSVMGAPGSGKTSVCPAIYVWPV